MCNVKSVPFSDEPTVHFHKLCRCLQINQFFCSLVQLIVVVFQAKGLLFWFNHTTLTAMVPATAGGFFSQKHNSK